MTKINMEALPTCNADLSGTTFTFRDRVTTTKFTYLVALIISELKCTLWVMLLEAWCHG